MAGPGAGALLSRWVRRRPACACSLLAALCYLNTLRAGFVYDDTRAILTNGDVRSSTPLTALLQHDFWGTPLSHGGSHGSYRPLTVLTFRLNHALAGLRPALYHTTNVALHAVCSGLVEAVAGLVGRADLLALLFTLCSLLSYARQAKEQGIAALPLCLLYDVFVHSRTSMSALLTPQRQDKRLLRLQQSCALVSLACAALLSARLSVLGGGGALSSALTLIHLPAVSVGLLLLPHHLSFDWSDSALPPLLGPADPRNAASAALLLGLAALLFAACRAPAETATNNNNNGSSSSSKPSRPGGHSGPGRPGLLFALCFSLLTFLPASNLLFYVGFLVAERVLYAPSVGFCLLVGRGLSLLEARWRRLGPALSALLLAVLAARTLLRNEDWRDEQALYTAGVPYSPAKALGNLATIMADRGRLEEAERAYRAALAVRYNMADVHYNLGNLLYSQGKYAESTQSYQKAVGFRRQFAQAYLNLAHAHIKLGQSEAARRVLLACRDLNGSRIRDPRSHTSARVSCLVELGRLFAEKENDPPQALTQYQQALELASEHYHKETIYNLIGEAQYRLSNYDEAEAWFRRALEIQPGMVHAHIFYGKMLAKNKTRMDEAEGWFHRARTTAPFNYVVYLHYGQFLYDAGRLQEAAEVYLRGVELAPSEYDLTFNLANVYRELSQYERAEFYYRRATHIRPEDVHSHRNLGAILHLNGKLQEAEAAYLTALGLSPGDHVTEVNLARLYNIMERRGRGQRAADGK
ncbi:protein O-mannosyl-transferase TMTC2-like [Pollicipes pollicipes]|uniref:protein O-mannosyl-transferase TMTC2-like n=1 Tax=Pollicipes pollicipes TaxID=41117 RepID=UPI0018856DBD|nr:protein O-mannosyl-transferase TMTC2-like [Pollicipes pollicipes]